MTYRILNTAEALKIISWAEENGINYDVWNAEESIIGGEKTELGLERWPNQNEILQSIS